jgi:tetratricopeptide (TPR) repeat protein
MANIAHRSPCVIPALSVVAIFAMALAGGAKTSAQTPPTRGPLELTSPLGRKLYALPEDAAVAKARHALDADPKNPALALDLSKALAACRQYNEAIAVDTAAMTSAPTNAELFLERGHRKLGLRQFAAAQADLEYANKLDPKLVDVYYHLALAHYFQGQFADAARLFAQGRDIAKTDDLLIDYTAWLYSSLRRAGKDEEAAAALTRITPEMKNTEPHLFFYLQLIRFYQGKLTAQEILPPPPSPPGDLESELSFDTVTFGVGTWNLYHHDNATALSLFRKVVQGDAWNAWGFVGSETELARAH